MGAWSKRRVRRLNSISFNSLLYECTRLFLSVPFGVRNHYWKLFILLIRKGLCRSERYGSPPLLVTVNICCWLIKSPAPLRKGWKPVEKDLHAPPQQGGSIGSVSSTRSCIFLSCVPDFTSKRFKTGVLTCRLPLDLQHFQVPLG